MQRNNVYMRTCRDQEVKLFGAPMEDTVSFRPGTRFAPQRVRFVMPYIEPTTLLGSAERLLCDMGDVNLLRGAVEENLARLKRFVEGVGTPFIMLGGEHTVTLAALEALRPDTYVHVDAHFDLRDEWPPGQKLSHATFLRRAHERLGFYAIVVGVRAYGDEEYTYANGAGFFVVEGSNFGRDAIADAVSTASGRVYVSIDVDVLDPSQAPGVGVPEAGGISYSVLESLVADLVLSLKPIAVDIVEFSPLNDVSDITAVKVSRLLLHVAKLMKCAGV